ncbi:uncharacterized protein LOC122296672 [Carya illinoinensis]|uniref:uncharacterized protein LOC122296672 n=1 Tax=Carya illinoinensis TaxID=32201 RepID=UPI001C71F89A|nr:uncharacterized protein LOC122296672 [Carya illinoinensis]
MGAGIEDATGYAENDAVVHVHSMTEELGLLLVDVSQEDLVSIVVAHAEQVRDLPLVEPSTEKEIIGDSNVLMACLSDPEMGEGKIVLHNDVSSDVDIREAVKKQNEDGHKKLRSSNRSYSWCNGHAGNSRSWARLDRSLVDQHFLGAFSDSIMRYLPRTSSDHTPMVISLVKSFEGYGPAPFHFQQMWVDHVDFARCVPEAWDQNDVGGALMKMVAKLKRVRVALKAWNQVVFGWTSGHIQELEARIERLDEQLQVRYEEDVELDLLTSKMELDTWTNSEEIQLAQCAKVSWWKHGDKNSRYFHALLNKKKQTRIMEMSLSNGTTLKTPQDILDGAVKYFMDFLGQSNRVVLPDLGDLVSNLISDEDNLRLCTLPTEEEVKQAIFSIPIESSPGPDGFGSGFYRACWNIVRVDVVEVVRDFFKGVLLPRFYTASFIVLIPKMAQPTGFDKFRPISLCSIFYKICTKVLVARLAPLLPAMISSE